MRGEPTRRRKKKLLARVQKITKLGSKVLLIASGAAIGCLAVLVAVSSISRYAFNKPVFFMEELAGLLLMASAFLAFAAIFVQGQHIKLTLITGKLPARVRGWLGIATSAVVVFYLILYAKLSYDFTYRSLLLDCHSHDAGLYEVPWMAVMPLSMLMFSLVVLTFGFHFGRGKSN